MPAQTVMRLIKYPVPMYKPAAWRSRVSPCDNSSEHRTNKAHVSLLSLPRTLCTAYLESCHLQTQNFQGDSQDLQDFSLIQLIIHDATQGTWRNKWTVWAQATGKLEPGEQSQQRERLQHFKLLPKASSEISHCSTLGTSADFCYKMHASLQQTELLSFSK